jgi:hypothetical protein
MKIANKFFENVAKFEYLERTLINQNCMYEQIKSRLNWEIACYHLVQNIFPRHMLSKNIKIKIHKIIFLLIGLHGCVKIGL